MTDRYKFWRDSLAGLKPAIVNEDPQCGFYRMKRGNRWIPVAVWPLGQAIPANLLGFKIGSEVVEQHFGVEQWPWYAAHAVTEPEYRRVAEQGQDWSDADPTVTAMLTTAATESTRKADMAALQNIVANEPKLIEQSPMPDPIAEFREQIKTALTGLKLYAKIETDEKDVQALSLRNMLNELANEADKAREIEKAPHFKKAKAVDDKWQPMIKEAREGAKTIKEARDIWAEDKRKAAVEAQRRADAAAEQHRREAEAAAAANRPAPPPPQPAQSNLPPVTSQVRPTYGRASGTGTKVVVTAIDYDKMIADLKSHPDLWERFKEIMLDIAQKCASKGIILDGVTTEERASTR